MTMDFEDDNQYSGWTAPKGPKSGQGKVHVGYVGKLLEGFTLSTKTLKPNKVFPPPTLPRHFKPVHRFKGPVVEESIANAGRDAGKKEDKQKSLTATDRALQLGESPIIGSVFDLLSKEDKEKMDDAKSGKLKIELTPMDISINPMLLIPNVEDIPLPPSPDKAPPSKSSSSTTTPPTKTSSRWDMKERKTSSNPSSVTSPEINVIKSPENVFKTPFEMKASSNKPMFMGNLSFKPFVKFPEKQARYEKYLSLVQQGRKDPYLEVVGGSMTEWEREREREEFVKAGKFYKPLSGMMASRFTSAKYGDDTETVDVPIDDGADKSDKAKAVEMKMFGQLTRETFEWHPDKVLCKRFNVPDPYPGSSISGLPSVKRDKYSVYNFLSFPVSDFTPGQTSTTTPDPLESQPLAIEDKPADTMKKAATSKVAFHMKKKPSIFNVLFEDEKPKTSHYKGSNKQEVSSDKVDLEKASEKEQNSVKSQDVDHHSTAEMEISGNKNVVTEKKEEKPFDLFRAVFKNSDSEISSSSSSEEDEQGETVSTKTSSETLPKNIKAPSYRLPGDGTIIQSVEERLSPFVAVDDKTDSNMEVDNHISKSLPSDNVKDNKSLCDSGIKNSEPRSNDNKETQKLEFSKPSSKDSEERNKFKFSKPSTSKSSSRSKHHSRSDSRNRSRSSSRHKSRSSSRHKSRSSSRSTDSEEEVEYYGPVPPQPSPLGSKEDMKKALKEHKDSFKPKHKKKSKRKEKYEKSEKNKKQSKDKYTDKHKHRSKDKKSKHKKHKDKKSKKKKKKNDREKNDREKNDREKNDREKSDDSNESSEDTDVHLDDKKLDEQILSRLRDLPQQKKK
ncbi:hypothetical protein LOTGIDRAFT_233831 [Lottia gigantea]|uniref:G patch domain-containing protein n=1 Tax=Lottia gigantea TaxID=225164 RepID=V4A5S7_LOTGI|nr:hypothetical protein LOTGIDRAFT_233831 [Lottia gigantea]ESO90330.1 hypothetical protein LOTGIDRAFT_233831 [Lottia gigantea]